MQIPEADPVRLFERWFVQPLEALRRVPNGGRKVRICVYD